MKNTIDQDLKQELKKARRKSAKPMLWISMISMTMLFAGLTSAYVVSRNRSDWVSFDLPNAFYISTILIIISSITFLLAKKFIKNEKQQLTTIFLFSTLILGVGFMYFQVEGFKQLLTAGLFFTGDQSTVKSSFIYGITGAHLVHVLAGIMVLLVVIYNQITKKYSSKDYLGLELGGIFWHFLGILWIYLFFFFYFIR